MSNITNFNEQVNEVKYSNKGHRLAIKIEPKKSVLRDIKQFIRSDKLPLLKMVNKLEGGVDIKLDLSYSTILGYSKDALFKTFQVLSENVNNPLINDVLSTEYTQEELNAATMYILNSSIKLNQQLITEDGMTRPSFVDIELIFKAKLFIN
jgi:hypothetical protein